MGSFNTIHEIIIYGNDSFIIKNNSITHCPYGSSALVKYKFDNDIIDNCYLIFSNLKDKNTYVKIGHYNNTIYYISKINKLNNTYNSSKISKLSYGYKLTLRNLYPF